MTIMTDQATVDLWVARNEWVQFAEGSRGTHPLVKGDSVWVIDPPAAWTEHGVCEACDQGVIYDPDDKALYLCPVCGGSGKQREAVQVWETALFADVPSLVTVAWATQTWVAPIHGGDLIGVPRPVLHVYESDKRWLSYLYSVDGAQDHHITLPPGIDPYTLIGQWARGGTIEVVA